MNAFTTRDFATLLDEMIEADRPQDFVSAARPTIPFDFFGAKGAEPVSADPLAAAEYLFAAADAFAVEPEEAPVAEPPSVLPFDIAQELRLTGMEKPETLDRIRREFAFANHPDRVAEDLREQAMVRMQIANRLIDDAKKAWTAAGAGR